MQVVQAEHFNDVDLAGAGYTESDVQNFKEKHMGRKLPPQKDSTEELRAAGWQGPNPWATCVLENFVINS